MFSLSSLFLFGTLLVLARLLAWIVNLLVISPLRDPLRCLAGPEAPLLGSHLTHAGDPDLSYVAHEEWRKLYGKTFRIQGLGKFDYRLMSFDFRAISHILTSPVYEKPWQTRTLLSTVMGRGIFAMEGAEHHLQKRIISPAFTSQAVNALTPFFFQTAEELREKWDMQLNTDLPVGSPIDIAHWISRATFDAFGLACLNYNFNALEGETEDVYLAFRRLFDLVDKKSVLRILFPSIDKLWPDAVARSVQESLSIINRVGQDLVTSKKIAIFSEKCDFANSHEKDLLTLLIKSNLSSDPSKRLSDSDLLDQITSFLFAGSDSTALALTWCLYFLAQHPKVQTQLREDLLQSPPSAGTIEAFTNDTPACDAFGSSLPLLDAVVKESLRLCPPVHGTIRVATEDDFIPVSSPVMLHDGTMAEPAQGVHIRKGSFVNIPIEGLNYSREIWGDNALEFQPERWFNLPANARSSAFPGLANVMTFSFGPHACPGYKFTLTEMKTFIATLLPHFEFAAVEGRTIGKYNGLLTRPFVKGHLHEGFQLPLLVKRV
ncbi:cytochrome P450 [Dendrothele bispora CBS 962.96]|uniref:Cytochrome P450 n=1 Tax=Dendrothele bispora (strain CBS 962.96) TaxID=1314807 RepID=A0A4S8LN46_DENBC|nr:cytochrome P450 [Dendrothele bispora CBS 962.96]